MNIASQDTINKHGIITPNKKRLTHDQSYIFQGSGTSVNLLTDKTKLTSCVFGWVIRRLAHWIIGARQKHPGRQILATKIDFKSAYRRGHLHHSTATQSCAQLPDDKLALVMLRLTFGGAPCLYEWSVISEVICDLATAIIGDKNWNPNTTYSPDQHLVPGHTFLPDGIPFAEGKEQIVDINIDDKGTHDMYLDDLVGLTINIPGTDNIIQAERAPLLAIHTCTRPVHENHARLPIRCLPSGHRGIHPRRLHLVLPPPQQFTILSFNQPSRTLSHGHHTMGGHTRRPTQPR